MVRFIIEVQESAKPNRIDDIQKQLNFMRYLNKDVLKEVHKEW
jgi:hypothetical protein